jgi:hypothetical protein
MIGSMIADRLETILIGLNQKEDTNLIEEKKRGPEGNDNFEVWTLGLSWTRMSIVASPVTFDNLNFGSFLIIFML